MRQVTRKELTSLDWQNALAPIGDAAAVELGVPFRRTFFFRHWCNALKDNSGAFFAASDGTKFVGILAACFWRDDFSGKQKAGESHWYVIPEARRSRAAFELFRQFEGEARRRQCDEILVTARAEAPAAIVDFYVHRGFSFAGGTYRKAF